MHSKVELEPVVPKFACCLLYNVHAIKLAVSPKQKFRDGQKLANRSQPFLDQSSPNLENM